MKTVHTLLSLVVIVLTVGCYEHGVPALFVGESQPEPAEERHFMVSLEELDKGSTETLRKQFFEERGASSFWRQLQGLDNKQQKLELVFELHQLEKEGVADEVAAGIIQYLAYYHNDRVNALQILGSAENENKRLTSLDPAIGELKSLQVLYLYNNQLQALPAEIGQLKSLQVLYLYNNKLQALPAEFGELKSLQKLGLGYNQLQALPAEIRQLKSLQVLYLYNNQLQALPAEIGQLKSLQVLYLYNNRLQALPAEMGQLKSLQELGLGYNQLQALPAEIGQLESIQELYLSNNQLQALPAEIGQLKSLQKLYLSNNQLRALPTEIGQLKSLQKLHLPNNQLQALPVEIRQLESLQRLWLAYNQLQALPAEIGQLESIQELYLSNNQLTCLSEKLYPLFQQGKVSATSQNPWLQPTNLRPEDPDSLAAKAYKPLPRSLRTLCTLSIDTAQLTLEQQQKLPYPQFLKEKREEGRKECQWNEGKGIVYFYQGIPFYLDRQLCTPQDVEPMLKELEGKQCYRLPEDLSRQ